jgi:opacity protein-like surface antigen
MIRKFLLGALAVLGVTSAFASGGVPVAPAPVVQDSGVYFGLEAGYANSNWKDLDTSNAGKDIKDDGWAGRALLGYTFNKYFDLELGYLYMGTKTKLQYQGTDLVELKTSAFDLLLKVKGPIADNFDLYAGFGPGYVMTKGTPTPTFVHILQQYFGVTLDGGDLKSSNLDIVYAVGFDWHVTDNVIVDLGLKHFCGQHKLDKDYQPSFNFAHVGVKYFIPA